MNNVIITGVTGQDGSYLVDYLLANTDYEIYGVMRRLSVPNHENLKHVLGNKRFHLIQGDLADFSSIEEIVRKYQPLYFINFAAQSFVAESWNTPEYTFNINALGTIRCLEAIRKNAPHCRFYSAGSSEEFGDVAYSPQDIKHPLRPRSPYGASKASARHLVKVYRESYNLYALHSILFNHESERRGFEFVTRKITSGVARIKYEIDNNLPITPIVLGNLDAKRDWSHSKDFVRGVWMMMNQEKYNKELHWIGEFDGEETMRYDLSKNIKEYVLASGQHHTVRDFIEIAFKKAGISVINANPSKIEPAQGLMGEQINYTCGDKPVVLVSRKFYRPADVESLLGDSSDIRKDLGWKPEISFEQLVEGMVSNDIKLYEKAQRS